MNGPTDRATVVGARPDGEVGAGSVDQLSRVGPVLEFLEFIDQSNSQPLEQLLERVLLKARQLTGAEAGSIFILQRVGKRRVLVPGSIQNDAVTVSYEAVVLPVTKTSIGGYVAETGETLFISDLYNLPPNRPFSFNRVIDEETGYRSRTMLAFPLTTGNGKVVAVVQLLNRRQAGADDILAFEPRHAQLIAPINHFAGRAIERVSMTEAILRKNRRLSEQRRTIAKLHAETEDAFMLSIRLLARAAELHDEVTGNHIVRVNEYSYALAVHAGQSRGWCDEIRYSAQLHDVGKMSIDAAVLKKKGGLTAEEWAEMRRHPDCGYEILNQSHRLRMAADIARCHHEKWDGSGYPNGLRGEQIPLSARIVAVADVYDALRSTRPYKKGFTHEEARRIILDGDDRINPRAHFDPRLLDLFADNHVEFDQIWLSLLDQPQAA